MSLSLPGIYLYHLSSDNLPPEQFERIVSSHRAWLRICREYVFDDGHNTSRYIINMREGRTVHHRTPSRGIREKEKLEKRVLSGDVVMLSDIYGPANLFHINQEGALICPHPLAFGFEGAKKIIAQYDLSVRQRDYRTRGGKPRPTPTHQFKRGESPVPERSMLSRAADESGRVLSAKWQSLSDSAKTVWEATPFTHDKATTEAARGRIADGAMGALEGLTTLMGPSSEDYMAGAFNPELAAINTARQENQQAAVKAIYDSTTGAVTDAYDRNGLAGAAAMIATTSVTELAGTKGIGRLNTAREIEALSKASIIKKVNAVSDRHAYLNEKFGRTGDINRDINIRSNKETVRNFMQAEGIPKEQIAYLEKGINLNERVSVESINKSKLAYQNQAPGNWQGNWYSLNDNTPPTKLGINPEGNLRGTDIKVPKVTTTYQSQQQVPMLRSTANSALDTWSVPKEPFQTEGGGIQWFSTNKDAWSPKK